jgi:single-stranded DNA-binding protein
LALHINHVLIVGRVSKAGPRLSYASSGTPICALTIEVDEIGKGAEVFTTWIQAEVSGKYAEQTAGEVEAGDEVMIAGKLKYKSVVDAKTSAKVSKFIVSTWGIQQRRPALAGAPVAARSETGEGGDQGKEAAHAPEAPKKCPRYPKWKPSAVVEPN